MRLVALTGAGISAESGVPTFRGAAGLWRNHRPEDLATPSAFLQDPKLVWEFYSWRRELVSRCEPNQAHSLLADIEANGYEIAILTQNVDGLHQKAGSRSVIELHGSLWKLKCTQCTYQWEASEVPLPKLPPNCPECRELARPDVVWFGETLDPKIIEQAQDKSMQSDTMLVIGTSALVYPAAGLPLVAKKSNAKIIEINPQTTPISNLADEVYRESASRGLKMWMERNGLSSLLYS